MAPVEFEYSKKGSGSTRNLGGWLSACCLAAAAAAAVVLVVGAAAWT